MTKAKAMRDTPTEAMEALSAIEKSAFVGITSATYETMMVALQSIEDIARSAQGDTAMQAARSEIPDALIEENKRLRLIVRGYVDPAEVADDLAPLIQNVNDRFDSETPVQDDDAELWAVLYLHDWDDPKDGKQPIYPEIHGVFSTWREAEAEVKSKESPEKYSVRRAKNFTRQPSREAIDGLLPR